MGKRVKDFRPARVNANRHTARGMSELQKSIQQDGWIGAMTTAADGEMIAGSARIETVAQVFGTDAEPIVVESDGTRPVVIVRKDIPTADDKRAQRLALADNRIHALDLNFDVEVIAGLDADVIGELWTPAELSDLGQAWANEQDDAKGKNEHRITRTGRLYNNGAHDVEPYKLAHRVEAIWQAEPTLAIDLYSGVGQLASWYRRRFARVVTVDKNMPLGDVDYSMSAGEFIAKHLDALRNDFSFVDFDDEGCPAGEIQAFFARLKGYRRAPFILALTDGNGLNLKCCGKFDFRKNYLRTDDSLRQATDLDYETFGDMVTDFVHAVARDNGFCAANISSYRGRENNVMFQTWRITCAV